MLHAGARRHPSKDAAFDLAKGEWFEQLKVETDFATETEVERSREFLHFVATEFIERFDAQHQFLMISIAEMRRQS